MGSQACEARQGKEGQSLPLLPNHQVGLRAGLHFGGHLGYQQGGWSEPGWRSYSYVQGVGQGRWLGVPAQGSSIGAPSGQGGRKTSFRKGGCVTLEC